MQQTKIWVASAVSLAYMTLFKCKSWLLLLLFVYLIAALVEQRPSGQGPWCLSWRKSIMVTFTARIVVYCKVLPKTLWNWWQRDLCVELWSGKQLSSHAPPSSWYRLLHTPAMTQNILHQNPSQLAWSERFRFPLSKHRDQTWVPHRYRVYSSRSTNAKICRSSNPLCKTAQSGTWQKMGQKDWKS